MAAKIHFFGFIARLVKKYKLFTLRRNGAKLGRVICHGDFHFEGYANLLEMGDDVHVNQGVIIQGSAPIRVGNHVHLSYGCKLVVAGLELDDTERLKHHAAPIVIEDNAWIGARAIILGGVRVGRNAVVAAGAVVTKDVPDDTVVGGVPAKFLRQIEMRKPCG